ncbi:MAG: hypothetical protein GY880_26125 [Planctomycetaceae bacterium]|nr:hypothetical protein [Planctomycetaceae bacterium]
MNEQHPLTDEMIEEIAQFEPDLTDPLRLNRTNDMRAAANWQLEQVIKWIKSELGHNCYLSPLGYYDHEVDVEYVLEDLEEAMRPEQQQQEEN